MMYLSRTTGSKPNGTRLNGTRPNVYGLGMAVSALALLSACASNSVVAERTLNAVPTEFSESGSIANFAASTADLPLNWVITLQDPAVEALIAEAMAHNNNLGAAAERVVAARQGAKSTRASLLPSAGAGVSYGKDLGTGIEAYTFSPSIDWELDVWARLTDNTRAAYLDATAARADFEAARLSIAGAVAQNWYAVVNARLQRELSERDVASGEANLRITERRYERGVSTSLDVRLARSSLAGSKAGLLSRQGNEKDAVRRLELLLGRYPQAELAVADELPTLASLSGVDGQVYGIGTPQAVLERRPDLIAAESRMRSDGLNASAARKAMLPSLRLSGSGPNSSTDFSDAFKVGTLIDTLSASLAQPIFQGGRLRANAKASEALARATAYTYAQTVLAAFSEIESGLMFESLLEAREDALRLAFEEAVATEDLTQRQYTNGTTNIFNLINAQQRRIQSESAYIQSKSDRLSNRIDLYMALGGTFAAGDEPMSAIAAGTNTKLLPDFKLPLFQRWWSSQYQPTGSQSSAAQDAAALIKQSNADANPSSMGEVQ